MTLGFKNYKYIIFLLTATFLSACMDSRIPDHSNDGNVPYRNVAPRIQQAPYNPYYYPPAQQQVPVQPRRPIAPSYGYPQPAPTSRYYSNPYAAAPAQGQVPYYDSDQYYVAPSYYGTTDIDIPDAGFEKF